MIIRISSNHFCAGAITRNNKVEHAAPIIKYMIGWNTWKVYDYCNKKNWKVEDLSEEHKDLNT